MADRSVASLAGAAGCADFSRASSRIGMLVGDVISAGALGTNEKPVMVPLALRLTSAVTCCHRGLLAEITSSPPFLRAPDRAADVECVTERFSAQVD
jgi:hypothetical protein